MSAWINYMYFSHLNETWLKSKIFIFTIRILKKKRYCFCSLCKWRFQELKNWRSQNYKKHRIRNQIKIKVQHQKGNNFSHHWWAWQRHSNMQTLWVLLWQGEEYYNHLGFFFTIYLNIVFLKKQIGLFCNLNI